jgi:hypothetical protein
MNKTERIKEVITKLPHSEGRVPYTYHHDHLRTHSVVHREMSRSEVAECNMSTEEELYSVALTQVLDEVGSLFLTLLTPEDIEVCREAKVVTDEVLNTYRTGYEKSWEEIQKVIG